MKIANLNMQGITSFKARCTRRIQKQFEKGQELYRNDPKAFDYYSSRISDIEDIAPDITVDSFMIPNPYDETIGRPTVIFRNSRDEIKFATSLNHQTTYKESIKTVDISTLDGITSLFQSLNNI